jgi:hypothetical protein
VKTGVRIPVGTPSAKFAIVIAQLISLIVPPQQAVGQNPVRRLIQDQLRAINLSLAIAESASLAMLAARV